MGFWPVVLNVIRNSDVILIIVDARIPEVTSNSEIIRIAKEKNKRLVPVFNKSDLLSQAEISKLKKQYPNSYFISAKKRTGVKDLKAMLENLAENWSRSSLRIGVVGYPNTGKSTLINLLAPSAKAKVSSVSGTTKKTQWVRIGKLRIMDSPGVIPFKDEKVQVGLTASKDPHKIRNPEKIAIKIIEMLTQRNTNILEKKYNASGKTPYEIFESIGNRLNYLIKGGEIDENRTAIKIIDDWQKGKIKIE